MSSLCHQSQDNYYSTQTRLQVHYVLVLSLGTHEQRYKSNATATIRTHTGGKGGCYWTSQLSLGINTAMRIIARITIMRMGIAMMRNMQSLSLRLLLFRATACVVTGERERDGGKERGRARETE